MKNSFWKTRRLSFWNGPCLGDILVSPPLKTGSQWRTNRQIWRFMKLFSLFICQALLINKASAAPVLWALKSRILLVQVLVKEARQQQQLYGSIFYSTTSKKNNNCVDDWCVAFCLLFPFFFRFFSPWRMRALFSLSWPSISEAFQFSLEVPIWKQLSRAGDRWNLRVCLTHRCYDDPRFTVGVFLIYMESHQNLHWMHNQDGRVKPNFLVPQRNIS